MDRWIQQLRGEVESAETQPLPVLKNAIPAFLDHIALALSPESPKADACDASEVCREHGAQRATVSTYTLGEVLKEYQLLHKVILDTLSEGGKKPSPETRYVIMDSIHEAAMQACREFLQVQQLEEDMVRNEAAVAGQRLRNLAEVMELAIVSSASLDRLLTNVLAKIRSIFSADTVSVLLLSNDRKHLRVRASLGLEQEVQAGTVIPVGRGIAGQIFSRSAPVSISDLSEEEVVSPALRDAGLRSLLGTNLRVGESPIGVLHLATRQRREFTEEDAKMLQLIADRIAVAIDHARLYDRIQADIQALQEERALREQFVSTLTHDLRTPLTAAKMNAQLISRKADEPETVRSLTSRISSNIDRADQMIRDLLDVSRIRAGQRLALSVSDCDLTELVEETLQDLETVLGSPLHFDKPKESFTGFWDCKGIRRVLENLCTNAAKYGAPGAPITIHLDRICISSSGSMAELSVHNEGNALSTEEINTVFQPFRRTSAAGSKKGWGLGLTLVRGVAEAHGGTVTVKSAPEDGTTFTVILPFDARAATGNAA